MTTNPKYLGQAGRPRLAYFLAGFLAVFFVALDLCGVGGVSSIRRTVASKAGESGSCFCLAVMDQV